MSNTEPSASVVPIAEINSHPETGLRWQLPLPGYDVWPPDTTAA